jgi:hypothetical protein
MITYNEARTWHKSRILHSPKSEMRHPHPTVWNEYVEWKLSEIPLDDNARQQWWESERRKARADELTAEVETHNRMETRKRLQRTEAIARDDLARCQRRIAELEKPTTKKKFTPVEKPLPAKGQNYDKKPEGYGHPPKALPNRETWHSEGWTQMAS